jgi:hypothetical protein
MATVAFNSNEMRVYVDSDGRLPYPVPDENGLLTYTATLLLDSGSIQAALLALHSKVTVLPAMGGGGLLVTERGVGPKHLIYPTGNGETEERFAILIDFQAHPLSFRDSDRTADATWILGDIIS